MSKITIVGSISMDLVTMTDRIPASGETVVGEKFAILPGGKGANQAVAAARLFSQQVALIGNVGQDFLGEVALKNLKENQLIFDRVGTIPHETGIAQITLFDKDNRIIVVPGANQYVLTENWTQKEWDELKQSELVILQNEVPHQTNLEVARFCKKNQIKVLYNPAPARETDIEMLDYVDYLTPNEHECAELFPNERLDQVLKRFPNQLIVTLGAAGVAFYDGQNIQKIPSIHSNVVDTTGAGDTFNGAFAVSLINGLTIKSAVKFAILASHLSIQKVGAQGGMPNLTEMKESQYYEKTWTIK